MKITAITKQVKRAGRYSVFVEGKYSFSLSESQVLQTKIHPNQEITEKELVQLKGDSEFGKVYERILNLLSFRRRSEWELRDYLKRKKQSSVLIEKILSKLSENGHVNDEEFAKRWVQNRRLLKPISVRKLHQELTQKRISQETIDMALSQDETNELGVLRELVERKAKRYPDQQKLIAYLARQGFNYQDIKHVLAELSESNSTAN